MNAAVVTAGLGRRFGSKWAVQDCSFEIPEGRICGLVGANGAGKTTLLRMLAGLSRPSAGSAEVAHHQPGDTVAFLATSASSPRTCRCTGAGRSRITCGWARR